MSDRRTIPAKGTRLTTLTGGVRSEKGLPPGGDMGALVLSNTHHKGEFLSGRRTVIVYGTVMVTRLVGRHTLHRVEATGPGGAHIEFEVTARKRHRGSVRVIWDPDGVAEPRFAPEIPWQTIGAAVLVVVAIVAVGWLIFA